MWIVGKSLVEVSFSSAAVIEERAGVLLVRFEVHFKLPVKARGKVFHRGMLRHGSVRSAASGTTDKMCTRALAQDREKVAQAT